MKTSSTDIDPRLDAHPTEGKAEFLCWSDTYQRLISSYLAGVEKLKEIRKLDPSRAALYDWKAEDYIGRLRRRWASGRGTVAGSSENGCRKTEKIIHH